MKEKGSKYSLEKKMPPTKKRKEKKRNQQPRPPNKQTNNQTIKQTNKLSYTCKCKDS